MIAHIAHLLTIGVAAAFVAGAIVGVIAMGIGLWRVAFPRLH